MSNTRYLRQTILKDFGEDAQEKLKTASVLVVGAGGLGVPVLQYLNAMGVGTIGIIDKDVVSLSNLHRQVLYKELDINQSKVKTAVHQLKAQNSQTHFNTYEEFLSRTNALEIIKNYDIVVDASDNFSTRYLVNDACVLLDKPFVYGALHSFEGYVSVFNYKEGPTYRCLFPNVPKANEIPNCNEQGVLGVLPGIVGTLQAMETVKVLTGIGTVLSGKLLVCNALENEYHKFNIALNPGNKTLKKLKDSYELSCDFKEVQSISIHALKKLIEKTPAIQIIDVRTTEEYDNYHLQPSKNIPLHALEFLKQHIDFSKPVYMICAAGVRSMKAINHLKTQYPSAEYINISGGLNSL